MTMPNALTRTVSILALVAILGGCSTLPRDGPSGRAVARGASAEQANYVIVDLDYAISEQIKAQPSQFLGSLTDATEPAGGGMIGPGDTLAVAILEPSGTLFGGGSGGENIRPGNQNLPAIVVNSAGAVTIPYAGSVNVAGLSATEAGQAIQRALRGKVGNPQVVVSVANNAYNTVTVLGEVRQPGRALLSGNANTILDIIAAAGGSTRTPEDVIVNIQRDGRTYTAPLGVVTTEFGENIRLQRGDQVNLTYRPRRYSTFGALGAISQVEMAAGPLTLAGALSRVGGLNFTIANARSVLVFRFERPEVAQAIGLTQPALPRGVPVVYRLNLEEGTGFFTANNFMIQPDDILYVPNSDSAELSKFFTLVQTFTRVIYDISVTNTLNQ